MKQTIFTIFLLLSVLGFISCKKNSVQPNIKQYDQTQILNYMAANNLTITGNPLTGFARDTVGGDTTGIYYHILTHVDMGTRLAYDQPMPMVYTLQTFDGTYVSSDTIANHFYDYAGHIQSGGFPLGLQTAIVNDLKYGGWSMRVLIPSHLAYGYNGRGSGSSKVANNRIQGNECLDYYVNIPKVVPVPHGSGIYVGVTAPLMIDPAYDSLVIYHYMKDSSLVAYNKTADSLRYKILTSPTSSDPVTLSSTVTATYTAQLYNATIVDNFNVSGGTPLNIADLIPGMQEGLQTDSVSVGTKISMLVPSSLAYGLSGNGSVPPFSCLRFTWVIDAVTP